VKRRLAHGLKRTARLLIKAANRIDPPRIEEGTERDFQFHGQAAGIAFAAMMETLGVSGQPADDLTPGWTERLASGIAGQYGGH
jgi:hypothetical protein